MIELKYVTSDVRFAFGVDGEAAWLKYRTLADRLTAEVESGERPRLVQDEVGILYKLLKTLDIVLDSEIVPSEFRAALNRIDIDRMYYGHVRIGMGDLLAIRSIEKPLAAHVASRIWRKVEDQPLMLALLRTIRGVGFSQGVQCDLMLASEVAYACLEAAAALAGDGAVTQEDIWRMAEANGFAGRRRLEASSPEGAAE
jgi:hypothetical protein